MATVGENIKKDYIIHAFDLEMAKNGSAKGVSAVLNDLMKELVAEINDIEPTAVKRAKYRNDRMKRLFASTDKTIKNAYDGIDKSQVIELTELANIEASFVAKTINTALGVDMVDQLLSGEVLNELATESLIQGAPSSEWWSGQSATLQKEFKRVMRIGIAKGETLTQLASRVQGTQSKNVLGVTGAIKGVPSSANIEDLTIRRGIKKKAQRNAEALVRTSFQTVTNNARASMYQGNEDVIKGEQFLSVLDSRTTPICRAYSGATWDLNGNAIGSTRLPYQQPPLHWNCRSMMLPIMKSLEEVLGVPGMSDMPQSTQSSFSKTGLSGQISEDVDFNTWLKAETVDEQNKILGTRRANAWRSGSLSLQDMISAKSGKTLTLKQLNDKI